MFIWRLFMFSAKHFIWIGLCIVFVLFLTLFAKRKKFSLKLAGAVMTAICAVSEVSKIMGDMIASSEGGRVLDPKSLPFHLCSLMIFGVLYITFGKEGKVKQAGRFCGGCRHAWKHLCHPHPHKRCGFC